MSNSPRCPVPLSVCLHYSIPISFVKWLRYAVFFGRCGYPPPLIASLFSGDLVPFDHGLTPYRVFHLFLTGFYGELWESYCVWIFLFHRFFNDSSNRVSDCVVCCFTSEACFRSSWYHFSPLFCLIHSMNSTLVLWAEKVEENVWCAGQRTQALLRSHLVDLFDLEKIWWLLR